MQRGRAHRARAGTQGAGGHTGRAGGRGRAHRARAPAAGSPASRAGCPRARAAPRSRGARGSPTRRSRRRAARAAPARAAAARAPPAPGSPAARTGPRGPGGTPRTGSARPRRRRPRRSARTRSAATRRSPRPARRARAPLTTEKPGQCAASPRYVCRHARRPAQVAGPAAGSDVGAPLTQTRGYATPLLMRPAALLPAAVGGLPGARPPPRGHGVTDRCSPVQLHGPQQAQGGRGRRGAAGSRPQDLLHERPRASCDQGPHLALHHGAAVAIGPADAAHARARGLHRGVAVGNRRRRARRARRTRRARRMPHPARRRARAWRPASNEGGPGLLRSAPGALLRAGSGCEPPGRAVRSLPCRGSLLCG